ncbi:transcriptional regulator, AsnC family [Thermoanaerobacter ethanolicus JW 200]|jgi:DNA-binding Lrp family transcriptional regulator|uniref:Transcriptional regulator n=1 Tax=Thermoanaerobacter siderophilus SR4 TaxID=880478 RepID=I9KR62_9THEO|nr:Lrp/AsnC family transcriptional regulator [Thermoanaerobacter siderophilus]EGD53135.1 transcriptional regulator, AsnC family [Thermoanaerobacter ethanolicus JW 200]EIV99373.1 transcriptional regulator [Thermoanaerobacter siderophilus SR4]
MDKSMEIIDLLCENSRLTEKQIATITGLSEEEVKNTIKNLEDKKVLLKYTTLVDWEKTDREVITALIDVRVAPQQGHGFNRVAHRICQYEEVKSVSLISGTYDLSVEVEGKTMKEIALFVAERLAPIEGVLSTTTHFVLKRYKKDGVFYEEGQNDKRLVVTP